MISERCEHTHHLRERIINYMQIIYEIRNTLVIIDVDNLNLSKCIFLFVILIMIYQDKIDT